MKSHQEGRSTLTPNEIEQYQLDIVIKPQQAGISRKQFLKTYPTHTIALDGYVAENSFQFPELPKANFNHHEHCDRETTPATCEQVCQAIRKGFLRWFSVADLKIPNKSTTEVKLLLNDCDHDVGAAVYLFENAPKLQNEFNVRLKHIIDVIGMVDRLGGTYYPRNTDDQQSLAWLFDHYSEFRRSGGLNRQDPQEYKEILAESSRRLDAYVLGQHKKVPVDLRYEKMIDGLGWNMIREVGAQGRFGAIQDGVEAFVSYSERPNRNHNFMIGKTSKKVPLNLRKLYSAFNEAEQSPEDPWGGSDLIGGSPRHHGSKLNPDDVTHIMNNETYNNMRTFFTKPLITKSEHLSSNQSS